MQSLTLIDALESKIGDSQIWDSMLEKGIMTKEKMKDLKGKAYRIIGKAELKKKNYQEAKSNLKAALTITTNEKMTKELNELLNEATKKLSQEEKKEKSTWQKAFKKGSKGEGDLYTSSNPAADAEKSAISPKKEALKEPKKETTKKNEKEEQQLWKPESSLNNSLFGSFVFLGVLGLLGTAAYWWTNRRR